MTNKPPDLPPGKPTQPAPIPTFRQPSLSTPPAPASQAGPPATKPAPAKDSNQPLTQAKGGTRSRWPVWAQQLPFLRLPEPKAQFGLIDMKDLESIVQSPDALRKIQSDMRFIDEDLLIYFREHDRKASEYQNQYRLYQIGFIVLATLATLVGSFQALALSNGGSTTIPIWAFVEVAIALIATFLANVSGHEAPLPLWLNNRRSAEYLRREYFRYLMNMPPYDGLSGPQRRTLMRQRAADINRGVFPDEVLTGKKSSSNATTPTN